MCSLACYDCACQHSQFYDKIYRGCPLFDARASWRQLLPPGDSTDEAAHVTRYVVACVYSGFSCFPGLASAGGDDPTYSLAQSSLAHCDQYNYDSVHKHRDKAADQVEDWLKNGWAVQAEPDRSVFTPLPDGSVRHDRLCVTPLGVVPKHGSYDEIRMIFDCRRSGLNETIPDIPFRYREVNHACKALQPGYWMAKVDIKSAFPHIHLRPDDWRHLGFAWQDGFCHMTRMPFGAKSAPYVFSLVGDAVRRAFMAIAPDGVVALVNYLDDFLLICRDKASCEAALEAFHALLAKLGLVVREDKTVPPTRRCEFLGVVLDSVKCELTVTRERLTNVKIEIDSILRRRTAASVAQLESLCGRLGWLARANPRCRPYLRRLLVLVHARARDASQQTTTKIAKRRDGAARRGTKNLPVRLSATTKDDLRWWARAVRHWQPRTLFLEERPKPCVAVFSDASDNGWGATAHGEDTFGTGFAQHSFSHIYPKELYAVVRAAQRWGPKWKAQRVLAFVDNKAVVDSINKHSTRCAETLPLLRQLNLLEVRHGFLLRATHISGVDNDYADALSRKDKWHLIKNIRKPPRRVRRPAGLWNKF